MNPGTTISHYKILSQLGAGGMGVVYKAQDTKLNRLVALKFLPPELSRDEDANQRFIQEAQAVTALDHPNICRVHDIQETDDGRLFIVMAFYDGQSLKYRLKDGRPDLQKALSIAHQIAAGLDAAHTKGIIHRDIKPANIVLTEDGQVKILDFGLAKLSGALGLTKTGSTLGTTFYMSPEVMRGDEADHRADIWALGVVLYQLLTGERPFTGDYDQAVGYAVLNTDPDYSRIEDEIARSVVEGCLAKKPEDRYQSTEELSQTLKALAEGSSTGSIVLPRQTVRRSIVTMGLAAAGLAAVLIVGWFLTRSIESAIEVDAEPKREMLVVLPFENLGAEKDQYFADGMAEELNVRLASVSSIGVISRNTANKYRGTDKTTPEIAAELGVDYVIGGTVRWAQRSDGSRQVRISPQLIRVSDDTSIWGDSYDRGLEDIFDVQADVAAKIIAELQTTITPEEAERLEALLTESSDAYQAYLRGLFLTRFSGSDDSLKLAVEQFQIATRIDTLFMESYYQLALSAGLLVMQDWNRFALPEGLEEYRQISQDAAEKATAVAPETRAAYLANGFYNYYGERNLGAALGQFTRALEIAEDADALRAVALIHRRLGNLDFAVDYFDRMTKLEPSRGSDEDIGFMLELKRRYPEAEQRYLDAMSEQPDHPWLPCQLARLQVRMDLSSDRARRTLEGWDPSAEIGQPYCWYVELFDRRFDYITGTAETWYAGDPDARFFLTYNLALTYRLMGDAERERQNWQRLKDHQRNGPLMLAFAEAGLGNKDESLAALDEFRTQLGNDEWDMINVRAGIAEAYVLLGMYDEALDWWEADADGPGNVDAFWLMLPPYDEMRDIPRFQALVERFE